ncbi:MAG: glutathione S-transferase [Gammaproteobacteria bacterium]|nr:glutathione S-transferase [Gammaproteobacteria bacterium]
MQLYHFEYSGHSHRVRLFLSLLELSYESISVDILKNEQKAPEYMKLNPLGQVPTLVDGNSVVPDSTAALVYLAKKYDASGRWLPNDPAGAAAVQVWLSTAAGELYRGPATARAIKIMGRKADYAAASSCAAQLFQWMQAVLGAHTWLAAQHATIADIAMYSYVRVADEGELDITPYPAIMRWLGYVEELPGFEPMPRRKQA